MEGMYAGFAGAKGGHGGASLSRGLGFVRVPFAPARRGHQLSQHAFGCEDPVKTASLLLLPCQFTNAPGLDCVMNLLLCLVE
jgi:hypothetical protein